MGEPFYWIGVGTTIVAGIGGSIILSSLADHIIKATIFTARTRWMLGYKDGLTFLERRKADLGVFSYAFEAGEQAGVHNWQGENVLWPGREALAHHTKDADQARSGAETER